MVPFDVRDVGRKQMQHIEVRTVVALNLIENGSDGTLRSQSPRFKRI
jgi:hypothetical protein